MLWRVGAWKVKKLPKLPSQSSFPASFFGELIDILVWYCWSIEIFLLFGIIKSRRPTFCLPSPSCSQVKFWIMFCWKVVSDKYFWEYFSSRYRPPFFQNSRTLYTIFTHSNHFFLNFLYFNLKISLFSAKFLSQKIGFFIS